MIRELRVFAVLIVAGLAAGCTTFSEVPSSEPQVIGGVFRVQPGVLWSAAKDGNNQTWTINGIGLESISFFTNVADGEAIAPRLQGEKAPTFRSDMTASDIVDLYEAVLTARDYAQIQILGLRPHKISGQDAFRFEYTAFSTNGLEKKGIVIGVIDEEKGLNLVVYEAAAEHYFSASLDAAEKVLNSLERI
ncbi:MAG TPA: hypothetical protein EYP07_05805 [Kiloniellaceae bacterium]|nr:hypothetical protein [Kiloniellaceae bacterium]